MILSSRGKDVKELTFANITYFENNKRIITGFQETEHYRKSFFPNALLIDFFSFFFLPFLYTSSYNKKAFLSNKQLVQSQEIN